MGPDLHARADELIRTLGALGLAQEKRPGSTDTDDLASRAKEQSDSLAIAISDPAVDA